MQARHSLLINGISLLTPQTGIGRYTREICGYISSKAQEQWDCTFYYGYFSKILKNIPLQESIPSRFDLVQALRKTPRLKSLVRSMLFTCTRFSHRTFDLYWEPATVPLSSLQKKGNLSVATVHDFSWLHHPEWHPSERVERMSRAFWENAPRLDAIITDSEYVREEALSLLPLPPDKIHRIHCGVDHSFFFKRTEQNIRQTLRSLHLPDKYILITGTFEPRKNLLRAINAWSALPEKTRRHFPLVLAGAEGWKNHEIHRAITGDSSVLPLGYVDEETLAVLYSGASLYLYPSLYEGFGLPPLEAMACGAPVLASNASCIPEICGDDGAFYFDPLDEGEMARLLENVLADDELRNSIARKGFERAAQFSWRKSAEEHVAFFTSLLEENTRP